MPDFLSQAAAAPESPIAGGLLAQIFGGGPAVSPLVVGVRLLAALLLGRVVALVYTWTRSPSERTASFPTTLVLLTVLISMVTQVIGDSVARAFSLVGALSIVRFRTVVRDTEDTAFVIFAVIVGMAVGARDWSMAFTGIVIVGIGAYWMRPSRLEGVTGGEFMLNVRVAVGTDLNTLLGPTLSSRLTDFRLLSVGTAKQGMSLEASYEIRLKKDAKPDDLVRDLNRVEGVQNVEITASIPTEQV